MRWGIVLVFALGACRLEADEPPAPLQLPGVTPAAATSTLSANDVPPVCVPCSPEYTAKDLLTPKDKPKYPTVNISGALQVNAGWFSQSPTNRATVGDAFDGAGFRRARLAAIGSLGEHVDYKIQFDWAFPSRPGFIDVYFDVKEVPLLGTVRAGQWKQFFGLEESTSFRFNPFMERASIFLFQPFRRVGLGFYDHSRDETFTWAASVIGTGQDQFGNSLSAVNGAGLTSRATMCPVFECNGEEVVHLGAGYYLAAPGDHNLRFGALGGSAPEFGLLAGTLGTSSFRSPPNTPSFVDTGVMRSDLFNLFGTEFAWVHGPLSVQSEFNFGSIDQIHKPTLFMWGGYGYVTYFLTGEHRVYNRKEGVFERPSVGPGWDEWTIGAWEVGYRLSYIDATDHNIDGGRLLDQTLAVNWYLNKYTKISFNYIHALLHRGESQGSNADVYAIRGQIDF